MPDNVPAIRIFTPQDADPGLLDGLRISVLGYGHLGRPVALNLRDSGVTQLVVGNIADGYAEAARQDGFVVQPLGQAAAYGDIVLILVPDEVIPEVFAAEIVPNLRPGSAIVFASGYTLAYGLAEPPPGIDVLLLAPRMGGENLRLRFLNGEGSFAYVGVEQDASGQAWPRLLALAARVGLLQAAVELSARLEADLDLFVEQTMGAALGLAIMNAFAVGEEAGIPPEALVIEMYMSGEMETVFRGFREQGFFGAAGAHGPTALFGGFMRTLQLTQADLVSRFREILADIQSGAFARQFQAERKAGYPMMSQAEAMRRPDNPITQAELRVRARLAEAVPKR
jgi:ketol-acid reductoisomerase